MTDRRNFLAKLVGGTVALAVVPHAILENQKQGSPNNINKSCAAWVDEEEYSIIPNGIPSKPKLVYRKSLAVCRMNHSCASCRFSSITNTDKLSCSLPVLCSDGTIDTLGEVSPTAMCMMWESDT